MMCDEYGVQTPTMVQPVNEELALLQQLHGAVRSMMRSHGVDKERYEKAFIAVRNSMYKVNDYNERMDYK